MDSIRQGIQRLTSPALGERVPSVDTTSSRMMGQRTMVIDGPDGSSSEVFTIKWFPIL